MSLSERKDGLVNLGRQDPLPGYHNQNKKEKHVMWKKMMKKGLAAVEKKRKRTRRKLPNPEC